MVWLKNLNKDRASGIIIEDDKILLIHRIRDDREYWVLPGGSVEEGESVEQALIREMEEELGIKIIEKEFAFAIENANRLEHNFLIKKYEGSCKIGGPELERMSDTNQFILEKVNLDEISKINLLPESIKDKLLIRNK